MIVPPWYCIPVQARRTVLYVALAATEQPAAVQCVFLAQHSSFSSLSGPLATQRVKAWAWPQKDVQTGLVIMARQPAWLLFQCWKGAPVDRICHRSSLFGVQADCKRGVWPFCPKMCSLPQMLGGASQTKLHGYRSCRRDVVWRHIMQPKKVQTSMAVTS
jgi:hypothetical protein